MLPVVCLSGLSKYPQNLFLLKSKLGFELHGGNYFSMWLLSIMCKTKINTKNILSLRKHIFDILEPFQQCSSKSLFPQSPKQREILLIYMCLPHNAIGLDTAACVLKAFWLKIARYELWLNLKFDSLSWKYLLAIIIDSVLSVLWKLRWIVVKRGSSWKFTQIQDLITQWSFCLLSILTKI